MNHDDSFYLEQGKICLEAVNRLEVRRDNGNKLFTTIAVGSISSFGFLIFGVKESQKIAGFCTLIISLLSIFIGICGSTSLKKFKQLSSIKFEIITKIEKHFEIKPMQEEGEEMKKISKYNEKKIFSPFTKRQNFTIIIYAVIVIIELIFSILKIINKL